MNVDLLSDVLRVVRLDGAFFYRVEATAPWCVESRTPTELRPRVLPASEHLVAYHVLVEGECWAGLHGGEQTRMRSGDVVVFPLGSPHRMSSARGLGDALVLTELPDATRLPFTMRMGGGGEHAKFVCGFLGCDRGPFNPLLGALPAQLVVHGEETSWLGAFTRHALAESESSRAGGELVITRLAELMFIEVLRRHVESLPPQSTGWLAGLRDPLVGRALALLHGAPAREWSLQELAEESATSRTVLAERFGELVGLAPMQYLARWRMQLAAERLDHSTDKLATIAQSVGYASEAAFSRAFRKLVGASPSHWRARRTRVGAPDG
ncbi:MAG: AraC family transcriptional regulator [Planctomycetes bacterium]|nr:AraC family transcriptional regulator [Planctomycetota bacterium]